MPVPVSFARDLFNKYKEDQSVFNTPKSFASYFPGIYITNSYGQGRVMNVYDIEFVTYYKKYEKTTETTDTIYPAWKQSYMAVTPEVVYNNNISLNVDPQVQAMVNSGEAIVMGPAGYEVEATFPIQEIIDNYSEYKAKTEAFSEKNFSNIGKSSEMIVDIIDDCVAGRKIRYEALVGAQRKKLSLKKWILHKTGQFHKEVATNYSINNKAIGVVWGLARKIKHRNDT